jgi:hypothetical protein
MMLTKKEKANVTDTNMTMDWMSNCCWSANDQERKKS